MADTSRSPWLDGVRSGHVGEVVERLDVAQVDPDAELELHAGIVPPRMAGVEMASGDMAERP